MLLHEGHWIELLNLLDCPDRAFKFLIDHPSWINHVRHYVGEGALTDIGSGDGATMVIPGSHKSFLAHSYAGDYARGDRMDALPGAIDAHAKRFSSPGRRSKPAIRTSRTSGANSPGVDSARSTLNTFTQ